MAELLARVDGVSKKFCRDLRRSLWYGMQDLAGELTGRRDAHPALRPKEFWAVDDVSLELRRGECLGLIGHNGAGKTTLLRLLNGLLKPDRGRIEIRGRVGALIALGAGFNPVLTGRENIYVNAAILGFKAHEVRNRLDEIIAFSELEEFIDSPVQHYSSGMYTRLGFAIAAHLEPDVLLVDEALAVGDLAFVVKCLNRIAALRRNGTGVVFVAHSELQVREAADSCILMHHGKVACRGTPEEAFRLYDELVPVASDTGYVFDSIVGLELEGGSGTPALRTGEAATIEIRCTAAKACDGADFELRFWNARAQLVTTISNKSGDAALDLPAGESTIRLEIPRLALTPGTYRLAAGFRRNGEVLGWARDLAKVSVAPPDRPWAGTGIVAMDARFRLSPKTVPSSHMP